MPTNRVIPKSTYYSGQGQVIFGERNAQGRPINAYAIGNAPALEIQVSTTQVDHKESMSGQRATDLTLLTEKSATFNLTIESLDLKNLAAAFYGNIADVTAGTVVNEVHENVDSSKGGLVILRHNSVSNVTVSLVTGGTAVPASAYTLDPEFGCLQWNPEYTPAVTGNIEIDYEYAASKRLDALTQVAPPERYVRFHGINTIDDSLYLVEIPRAQFQPLQSLPLITEEIAQVQLTATILPDNTITSGSKFYRQTVIKALP